MYVGVTIFALCWSVLSLPGSCQPLSRNFCSQLREARSSSARCLTSFCLLYSFNDVTMQWDIVESCEESAPGYSDNFSGSTDCAQSSRARDSDCNVWFITSSLYSYIERLRPLNTQSLTLSVLLCTFMNQVLAELDLLWYWKETTAYKNDLHPLPKGIDDDVANFHLP